MQTRYTYTYIYIYTFVKVFWHFGGALVRLPRLLSRFAQLYSYANREGREKRSMGELVHDHVCTYETIFASNVSTLFIVADATAAALQNWWCYGGTRERERVAKRCANKCTHIVRSHLSRTELLGTSQNWRHHKKASQVLFSVFINLILKPKVKISALFKRRKPFKESNKPFYQNQDSCQLWFRPWNFSVCGIYVCIWISGVLCSVFKCLLKARMCSSTHSSNKLP